MAGRATEDDINTATRLLKEDRRPYWCILCARPRRANYCPVASRTGQQRHKVVARHTIPTESQLEYYLFRFESN